MYIAVQEQINLRDNLLLFLPLHLSITERGQRINRTTDHLENYNYYTSYCQLVILRIRFWQAP